MNKVTSYLKNVAKSISYATVDVTKKELFPEVGDFVETNSDVLKSTYAFTKDLKKSLIKTGKAAKKSKVYTEVEKSFKYALDDLKTGNFYNKERELASYDSAADSMMGGGDDWGDIDFNFDDDFDDDSSSNSIDKGDLLVADTVAKSGNASAQMISKAVIASNNAVSKTTMQSTNMLMTQNIQLIAGVRTSIAGVHESINSILKYTTENVSGYINASTEYYAKSYAVMEDNNKILKEMLDIQKKTYEKVYSTKTEDKTNSAYSNVFSGTTFDIGEYVKEVGKNIKSLDPTGMLSSLGKEGGMGDVLQTMLSNPWGYAVSWLIRGMIPENLAKSAGKFSKTLGLLPVNLISKLNKNANDGSGFWKVIGKIFGLKTDPNQKTIDPSKYEKGAIPFDGITRKAIVDVIPEHLARIESLLSGTTQRTYNYKTGKWLSTKDLQKQEDDLYISSVKSSFSELKPYFESYIKELEKQKALSAEEKRKLEEDWYKIQEKSYKDGRFNPKNNLDDTFNEYTQGFLNYLINNVSTYKKMTVNSEIYENRKNYTNTMQDAENSGYSPFAKNHDDSNPNSNLIYDKKYKDQIVGINSATSLTGAKDIKGKTIFDYLRDLDINLNYIRINGILNKNSSIGKKERRKLQGSGNQISNQIMSFDRFSKDFDTDFVDDKIKKLQESDNSKDESYDKYHYDKNVDKKDAITTAIWNASQKGEDADLEKEYGKFYKSIFDRDSKYAKEVESIKGDTFIEKFGNAKGIKQKYHVLSASLTGIAKKPAAILSGLLDKADKSIHDFLFEKDTDEFDENGKSIKGFFNATLNKMKEAWTTLTVSLETKVIDPLVRQYKLDEKWNKFRDKLKNSKAGEIFTNLKGSIKDNFKGAYDWTKNAVGEVFSPITESNAYKDFQISRLTSQREAHRRNNPVIAGLATGGIRYGSGNGKDINITVTNGNEDLMVFNHANKKQTEENAKTEDIVTQGLKRMNSLKDFNIFSRAKGGNLKELTIPEFVEYYNKWNPNKKISELTVSKAIMDKRLDANKKGNDWIISVPDAVKVFEEDTKKINILRESKTEKGNMVDEIIENVKTEGKNLAKKAKDTISEVTKKAKESTDKLLDTDKIEKDKKTLLEKTATVIGEMEGRGTDTLAKSIIGGGIGLLSGIVGGPLIGAGIGAGYSIIKNSNTVQRFLFGEEITNEDGTITEKEGLINKKIQDTYKKYIPDMGKYGVTGAIAGLLTPFGPFAGAAIGASIGFAKNSQVMQDLIFGKENENGIKEGGLLTPERIAKIKKAYPKTAVGGGLGLLSGFFMGPFGPIGNAAIGAGIGLLSTSDEFQELILGTKDALGNRYGGVLGLFNEYFTKPLKEFGSNFSTRFYDYMKKDIIDPLNRAITPITEEIAYRGKQLFLGIPKLIVEKLSNLVGPPLRRVFEDSILAPVAGFVKNSLRKGLDIVKGSISVPFKAIDMVGDRVRKSQIRQGRDKAGNAASRIQFADTHKMGTYEYRAIDEILQKAGIKDTTEIASLAGGLAFNQKTLRSKQVSAEREIDKVLSVIGYRGNGGKRLHNAIKAKIKEGDMQGAIELVSQIKDKNGNRLTEEQTSQLISSLTEKSRGYYTATTALNEYSSKTKDEKIKELAYKFKISPDQLGGLLKDGGAKKIFTYANNELALKGEKTIGKNDIKLPEVKNIDYTLTKTYNTLEEIAAKILRRKPKYIKVAKENIEKQEKIGTANAINKVQHRTAAITDYLIPHGYDKEDLEVGDISEVLNTNKELHELVRYVINDGYTISVDNILKLNKMKLTKKDYELLKKYPRSVELPLEDLNALLVTNNKHGMMLANEASMMGLKINEFKFNNVTKRNKDESLQRLSMYKKLKDYIGKEINYLEGRIPFKLTESDILSNNGLTYAELEQILDHEKGEKSSIKRKTSLLSKLHNKGVFSVLGKLIKAPFGLAGDVAGTALGGGIGLIATLLGGGVSAIGKTSSLFSRFKNRGISGVLGDRKAKAEVKKSDMAGNGSGKGTDDEENVRYENTENGMIKYIRNNQGEWIPDRQDTQTKATIAEENFEDKERTSLTDAVKDIKDKFNNFFNRNSEKEDDKKESFLSKLFNFDLGGLASKALTFGAGIAAILGIGKLVSGADPSSPIGKMRDWVTNKNEYSDSDKGLSGFVNNTVAPVLTSAITTGVELLASILPSLIWAGVKGLGKGLLNVASSALGVGDKEYQTVDEDGNVVTKTKEVSTGSKVTGIIGKAGKALYNASVLPKAGIAGLHLGNAIITGGNALSKIGQGISKISVTRGLIGTTGKAIGFGTDLLGKTAGKVGQVIGKIGDTGNIINNQGFTGVASKIISKTDDFLLTIGTKLETILQKLFANETILKYVNKVIKNRGEDITSDGVKKIISESIEKLISSVSTFVSDLSTGVAKQLDNVLGKAAVKTALLWLTIGYYFGKGMDQAEAILGIEKPTFVQTVLSGLLSVLSEQIFLGLISATKLVDWFLAGTEKIFGKSTFSELKQQRDEADKAVAEYNKEHDTEYTKEEYLKREKSVTGKIGGWFKDTASNAWNGVKSFFGKNNNESTESSNTTSGQGTVKNKSNVPTLSGSNVISSINNGIGTIISNFGNSTKDITKIPKMIESATKLSSSDNSIIKDSKTGKVNPLSAKYWKINSNMKKNSFQYALYTYNSMMQKVLNLPTALVGMLNLGNTVKNTVSSLSTSVKNGLTWLANKLGFKSSNSSILSGSGSNKDKSFVSQLDPAFSGMRFNKRGDTQIQTIADSGCAPATAANVLNLYSGRGSSLMESASKAALRYKDTDSGVTPDYFENYLGSNGISTYSTMNKSEMLNSISGGSPTILLGSDPSNRANTPYGSSSSHYVLATGLDGNGNAIVQDPESRKPNALYPVKDLLRQSHLGMVTGMGSRKISNLKSSLNSKLRKVGYGRASNKTINIPNGYGKVHTYMGWQLITAPSSTQYKLREKAGMKFDSEGFGKINNRYVIACTTTYGDVGDYIDFYKEDGNIINGIVGDIKNPNDAGCNKWGHQNGNNIVEFVVDVNSWYAGYAGRWHENPGNAGCHPEWGGKCITKAVNLGNYFEDPDFKTTKSGTSSDSDDDSSSSSNSIFDKLGNVITSYYKSDLINALFGSSDSSNDSDSDDSGSDDYGDGVGDKTNKAFYNEWKGKQYGSGQCAVLFQRYQTEVAGMPSPAILPYNYGAKNNWLKYDEIGLKPYFEKIPAKDFDKVKYGDWAIYGDETGQYQGQYYGHVGMVVGKDNQNKKIDLFGQNQNGKLYGTVIENNTTPSLGYLRAKKLNGSGTVNKNKTTKYLDSKMDAFKQPGPKLPSLKKSDFISGKGTLNAPKLPEIKVNSGKGTLPQMGSADGITSNNNSGVEKLINCIIEILSTIANNTSKLSEITTLLSKAIGMELSDKDIKELSNNNMKMKNKIANALKSQGSSNGLGNSIMNSSTESLAKAMNAIAQA